MPPFVLHTSPIRIKSFPTTQYLKKKRSTIYKLHLYFISHCQHQTFLTLCQQAARFDPWTLASLTYTGRNKVAKYPSANAYLFYVQRISPRVIISNPEAYKPKRLAYMICNHVHDGHTEHIPGFCNVPVSVSSCISLAIASIMLRLRNQLCNNTTHFFTVGSMIPAAFFGSYSFGFCCACVQTGWSSKGNCVYRHHLLHLRRQKEGSFFVSARLHLTSS